MQRNNTVYAVSGTGDIYALDASNGKLVWSYSTEEKVGSPLLINRYLYVGSRLGAYCFDATDGKMIWNFTDKDYYIYDATFTHPTYADGVIYLGWNGPMFFSSSTPHNFYALDASNGKKLSNFTLGYTVATAPIAVNGTVYICCNFVSTESPIYQGAGAVIALESNAASLLTSWSLTIEGIIAIAIVIVLLISLTAVFLFRKKIFPQNRIPAENKRNAIHCR